ncbi:response regulator [Arenibaculum sp.]|jgi:CheY-like chemotaxis protein|uniref:response regulator n=1 Tax=Arenibaculum sp. TaxID=2865862 RepID=UPI002E13C79C|nr:response regulator [Arenibaculum sp.]
MADEPKPILLVEDDPDDQLLIRRAFTKARLLNPLRVVGDGDAAVDYLSGAEGYADRHANPLPALLLLDLKLPRRSGLEVLEWLRSRPAPMGRTPVVVLTSSKESADVDRAYELGANSYLVKPVDFDGLLDMIKTAGLYWTVLNEGPSRG